MLNARPLLKGTIQAVGAVTIYRFVGFDGNQASAAGQKCRGVAEFVAIEGDNLSIVEKGSAIVEVGAAVAVGDDIVTDNEGRAVTASALAIAAGATAMTSAAANGANDFTGTTLPAPLLGRALSAATAAGQWIEVLLA